MLTDEKAPENSKQWFVFIDDRYRGPYSERQIRSTIEQGALKGANLIWKEGMLDWETLSKVAQFNVVESTHPADVDISTSALSFLDYMEPADEEVIPTIAPPDTATTANVSGPAFHAPPMAFNADFWRPEAARPTPLYRNKFFFAAGVVIAAAVVSFSLYQFTRAGFPVLKDLPAREGQELRAAALEDPAYAGTTAGLALVPGNPQSPRFYLSSNAANGEELEVQVVGQRDTMVDSFYYSAGTRVKVKDHFAKTPAFHRDDGRPLSTGDYTVTVLKNGQPLTKKTVFLGGVKDADYVNGLKNYQDRLRIQGEGELAEIRQVADLLEKQFGGTNQHFRQGPGWAKFHEQWIALQAQIEILFKEVNSEDLNREFYNGPLYGLLKEATDAVSSLHSLQNETRLLGHFNGGQSMVDAAKAAQSRLLALRAKLLQAERQYGL